MSHPYRPSNGTEGQAFIERWCARCERDKVMNGDATQEQADSDPSLYCEILCRSFCNSEPLPEWIVDDDRRTKCTAFVPIGSANPLRCERTVDMFGGDAP